MNWNLDSLSCDKAHNPGIVIVMARLLAHYHISVAIIQGITDPLALKEVSFLNFFIFSRTVR